MQARTAGTIAEGLVAGVLAHMAITVVLALGDLFSGRWLFYTPTLVGRVLLEGGGEGCQVAPGATILLAYSSIHLAALTLFGLLALGLLGRVQECVSPWPPTLAGFAGALAMAAYLWRSHPGLRQALRRAVRVGQPYA